jgi:rare lipoprotein A
LHYLAFIGAGIASYYCMPGARMANGKPMNCAAHTCAMRYEPFGTRVEIINAENGDRSYCVVSDRGPYVAGRVIDVSTRVRDELHMGGTTSVRLYAIH